MNFPRSYFLTIKACLPPKMLPPSGNSSDLLSQPKQRHKRWAPKVKTGCTTCRYAPALRTHICTLGKSLYDRTRHIKCDEEKPVCKRCTKSGVICRYFLLQQCIVIPGLQLQVSVSPVEADPAPAELEMNYYFRTQLMPRGNDEFNPQLWRLYLPQASTCRSSIWHACNFLAALYRKRFMGSDSDASVRYSVEKLYQKSLPQYSASLASVLKLIHQPNLSTGDKSTILATNILLHMCCTQHSDYTQARTIALNSIQLIRHWNFWEHLSSPAPVPGTLIMLYFVKIQRLVEESLLTTSKTTWHWEEALSFLQHRPFESCVDACLELEMLWVGLQAIIQDVPLRPTPEQLDTANASRIVFRRRFNKWQEKFEEFLLSSYSTKLDHGRIVILKVRQTLVDVLLRVEIANFETCWDECNVEFTRATLLIEYILNKDTKDSGLPVFTPMLAKSLQFMAKACRTPALRRRIITMLRLRLQRMASLISLSSQHTSYSPVIDAIVNLEEEAWSRREGGQEGCNCTSGCVPGEFICNHHRVAEIYVVLKPDSKEFTLRTVGDVLNGQPGRVLSLQASIWS